MRIHPSTDVVSSRDDGGCRHERRMPFLSRCQTFRENSRQASGRSFPEKGKCGGQCKRELVLPHQRASFSGDVVEFSPDHAS
jgi:hypothetical protein